MSKTTEQTDLYRVFDAKNTLLYVGISFSAINRMNEHSKDKPWWRETARIDVETLQCGRREALVIEAAVIKSERPLYNKMHNSSVKTPVADGTIAWTCIECSGLISNGDGYIELPTAEMVRHREEMEEHNAAHPIPEATNGATWRLVDLNEVMSRPSRMQWHAIHRICDQNINSSSYWFDVHRARTTAQLLEWTIHLQEKNWFADTKWGDFVRRAVPRSSVTSK